MNNYEPWCQQNLQRFRVRQDGKKADCCCPVHEDRNPSMVVNLATGWAECKSGNCAFNGPLRELAQRMGVSFEGVEQKKDWRKGASLGEPLDSYTYLNAEGAKYARVLRYADKRFRQQRWTGDDWEWKAPPFSIPYRLDRIHAADPSRVILWVEGEKDVDTAEWMGFTATTSPGGSDGTGKLSLAALGILIGRDIVVIPDNDEAGRKYARAIVAKLRQVGAKVRALDLSKHWPKGSPAEGADLSDWEQAGGKRDALKALVAEKAVAPTGEVDEQPEEPLPPRRVPASSKSTWEPPEKPLLLADGLLQLSKAIESGEQDVGVVHTGFRDLDKVLKGMRPQQLILVGARPAMGKSSFGQAVCYHVADNYGPVLQATLEMANEECVLRAVSMITRVQGDDITRDTPLAAYQKAKGVPLYFYDRPCRIKDLEALVAWFHDQHPNMAMLGVDYLGQAVDLNTNNKNNATEQVSGGLVDISKNHKIPIFALHQLSRDVEKRDNKRPMQSDLRDSGALEQDAHKILFLYRDEYYNPRTEDPGVAEVIIAKNRGGPTGIVRLAWHGPTYTFSSLARDEQAEPSYPQRNPAFPHNDDDFDTIGLDDFA